MFLGRVRRFDRRFKRAIILLTLAGIVALFVATNIGRYTAVSLAAEAHNLALRQIGLDPTRAEIDALWRIKRDRSELLTREHLARFYRSAEPGLQRLFQVAGMDPEHGLIRCGRADQAFLISSRVFESDDHGRSYRMRPNTRSVWLRRVTLINGPFGMFQVLETPEIHEAARGARAIVEMSSVQTTNSWGCRGPEPDTSATMRGLVLGDSFMQGMFVGDLDTPSQYLERYLCKAWNLPVCVLNTGHIGYSPEQYFYTLLEYGERFRPDFVVVSVCPNDFGDGTEVIWGHGDWWSEAEYWLGEILRWCRGHDTLCVLVPVPCEEQFRGSRIDAAYPGQVAKIFHGSARLYCDPLDEFIDDHLRLTRVAKREGKYFGKSLLYNGQFGDNHFSPRGAELWGQIVGRRVTLLLTPRQRS